VIFGAHRDARVSGPAAVALHDTVRADTAIGQAASAVNRATSTLAAKIDSLFVRTDTTNL